MKLILTSFGVNEGTYDISRKHSLFYRMPPVETRGRMEDVFVPDYSALLLCDKLIVDEATFSALQDTPHTSYTLVAETLTLLEKEGFIDLVNFDEILVDNQDLLEEMLDYDLNMLDQWVDPLKESLEIWRSFVRVTSSVMQESIHFSSHGTFTHGDLHAVSLFRELEDAHYTAFGYCSIVHGSVSDEGGGRSTSLLDEALASSRKRRKSKYRSVLKKVLSFYLSYVNANLVLSSELGTGFHDWADFSPFYKHKFLSVGRKDRAEQTYVGELSPQFAV